MAGSLIAGFYRGAGYLAPPLVHLYLALRVKRGREDPDRLGERFGYASLERPDGPLIWIHAASVGESLSALPLIQAIRSTAPKTVILVTTGTVTSAKLMREQLPQGVLHQFVPVDLPAALQRFLNHWKPNLGLIVESELWPGMIEAALKADLALYLVNARMSQRSLRGWRRFPGLARRLLGAFTQVFAQTQTDAERFRSLGADQVAVLGNLKLAATALGVDRGELARMEGMLAGRPRWLAASTHPGEEEIIARAHRHLRQRIPGLVTILAPRHPARGRDLAQSLRTQGLVVAQRSLHEELTPAHDIYMADTIGELGLWYRVAPVALLGGSLVPKGGQNPLEAILLKCAVVVGPHTHNFRTLVQELAQAGGLCQISDAEDLGETVAALLGDELRCRQQSDQARAWLDMQGRVLDRLMETLAPIILNLHA